MMQLFRQIAHDLDELRIEERRHASTLERVLAGAGRIHLQEQREADRAASPG
jgi:hypothetical protein